MKIKFGPAGTGGNSIEGVKRAEKLGLDAVEIEFVYGVKMKNSLAKKIGKLAKELKIDLSVHAPYYINLASKEKHKITASMKRILDSCERAHHLGARYVVFHAGFYQGRDKEEVYEQIKEAILKLMELIKEKGWKAKLAPETTGKKSQFGDLDELLRLKKETGCHLCVDFAHLLARDGKIDYDEVFKKLKGVKHIHAHFSGIEYTAKGEKRHILTPAAKLKELIKYIKKYKVDITVINESPDSVGDSLKGKKISSGL
jgi:deoxyribonuclease-4